MKNALKVRNELVETEQDLPLSSGRRNFYCIVYFHKGVFEEEKNPPHQLQDEIQQKHLFFVECIVLSNRNCGLTHYRAPRRPEVEITSEHAFIHATKKLQKWVFLPLNYSGERKEDIKRCDGALENEQPNLLSPRIN